MIKFKCQTDIYTVVNVKKVKSQRGNDYNLIIVKDTNDNELYFYDPKQLEVEIGSRYCFDLVVTISKYSSAEVIKLCKVEN